ncbi:MAG: FAD-dependent oxidoreductase [Chlamydiales bacterium]|nr:FAD-dependent oxidoreductase [Chlamydiales bacterium]
MKKFLSLLTLSCLALLQNVHAEEKSEERAVVVLGGGVGALTSATYLARAGIPPLVLTGPLPGGALVQSHSVQNWPGELDISGLDLVEKMQVQAETNGAELRGDEVIHVDFSKRPFTITTRDPSGEIKRIHAQAAIIALGAVPNMLGVSGEKTYWLKGVYNCAVCDGGFYKDKVVAIVGGGDSALTEAHYLSNIAKKVYLIVRKEQFKTVEEQRKREILARPNIELLMKTTVEEVKGNGERVTSLTLQKDGKEKVDLPVDALFLAIGSQPNTSLFTDQLALDPQGYIQLKQHQQTSVDGIFALGDVVDREFKQAVTAAGDGAKAALQAQKWLTRYSPMRKGAEEIASPESDIVFVKSSKQFQEEIDKAGTTVFVYFFSPRCIPCRTFGQVYEKWAKAYGTKVRFLKVNVLDAHDINSRYQIMAIPSLVILDKNGKLVRQEEGTKQIAYIESRLRELNTADTVDFKRVR